MRRETIEDVFARCVYDKIMVHFGCDADEPFVAFVEELEANPEKTLSWVARVVLREVRAVVNAYREPALDGQFYDGTRAVCDALLHRFGDVRASGLEGLAYAPDPGVRKFVCPIGHAGCVENCGNYGCGN